MLSSVCSSPTRNSSSRPGASGLGGIAASQLRSAVEVVEPVGGLRPGAGRRLGHQREPDLVGERQRLTGGGDQLMPGTRHPGGAQHRLHPGLVPHVHRGLHVHALDAQRLAHLGQRDLQLLQRADQAFHPSHLTTEAGHRLGDLARVECVVDPPVPGQAFLQHGGQALGRLGGDDGQPDAGQPRRRWRRTGSWPPAGRVRRTQRQPHLDATRPRRRPLHEPGRSATDRGHG